MDAADYVADSDNHGTCDILQVDLYDASARGPVLDSEEFYRACAACLSPTGIISVNLFGAHPSYDKNLRVIKAIFPMVLCLPPLAEGNIVVLAFKQRQQVDFTLLEQHAKQLQLLSKLPASSWLPGLRDSYQHA